MELTAIIEDILSGDFTCSKTMDILMDQPTSPSGRKIESHAHMHVNEGFTLGLSGFGGNKSSFSTKKLHWENPTHLYPEGNDNDSGRFLIDSGTDSKAMKIYADHYGGVFQDRDRLPPDRSFADRTGLGELAPETRTIYTVFKSQGKASPLREEYEDFSVVQGLAVGREAGKYLPKSKKEENTVRYTERTEVIYPKVEESPAHSMFPDSESLVMHLTAALTSKAGLDVLMKLEEYGPGDEKTVGFFSKTAVHAVANVDDDVQVLMINRILEVDTNKPRDKTGRYPATGRIIATRHQINHIVTVLGHRSSGDLNVITCFPSAKTTEESIKTETESGEDIAEHEFGVHTKVPCQLLQDLSW